MLSDFFSCCPKFFQQPEPYSHESIATPHMCGAQSFKCILTVKNACPHAYPPSLAQRRRACKGGGGSQGATVLRPSLMLYNTYGPSCEFLVRIRNGNIDPPAQKVSRSSLNSICFQCSACTTQHYYQQLGRYFQMSLTTCLLPLNMKWAFQHA